LTRDNAKLLQRWLDAKQVEANKMNEANEFYEDMRTKHQAAAILQLNVKGEDADDANGEEGKESSTGNANGFIDHA
jgi:autophagy-related protein 16